MKNTVNVNGSRFVGGLVGQGEKTTFKDVFNDATLQGTKSLGGIVGELKGGSITGESYNMGTVRTAYYKNLYPNKQADYQGNIDQADMLKADSGQYAGGLVGFGKDIQIGNESGFQIYNGMNITSGGAVGGIAGHVEGNSTIQNLRNDGVITATYKVGMGDMITYGGADINQNAYGDESVFANAANAGGIVGEAVGRATADGTNTITVKNAINTNTVTSAWKDNLEYGYKGDKGYIEFVYENGNLKLDKDGKPVVKIIPKDSWYKDNLTGYFAGNVGGIVGFAQNADFSDVKNENAFISGSHNVGGIAGRLDMFSTITHGINSGGAVTATGAVGSLTITGSDGSIIARSPSENSILTVRDNGDFKTGLDEFQFINAGGIAGYVSRNGTIKSSSNTGNVTGKLSQRLTGATSPVFLVGVGGIAGRIDQLGTEVGTEQDVWNALKGDSSKATIYDSYNTGTITGDRGVGGIAGAIYNGSISTSHNEGTVLSKGAGESSGSGSVGGIVGDARGNTAEGKGSILYNVYNKGTVGDPSFAIGARHIGGIVGHLAGIVDGAYNIGAVYNNDSLTGGIAGWFPQGGIYNSFNAGTVNVKSGTALSGDLSTAAGGIVGAAEGRGTQTITFQNVYNIGTIRVMQTNGTAGGVAGILGAVHVNTQGTQAGNTIVLDHVYTTGNIYSNNRTGNKNGNGYVIGANLKGTGEAVKWNFNQVYYIAPETGSAFDTNNNGVGAVGNGVRPGSNANGQTNTVTKIAYNDRYTGNAWMQGGVSFFGNDKTHTDNKGADGIVGSGWRQYTDQYGKTLPILNRFRPKGMDDWFNTAPANRDELLQNAGRVQFGNTVNPFLTFVAHDGNGPITVDADKFHFATQDGMVANGDLTINNFSYHNLADNTDTPVAFGGTIAAYNGKLTITGTKDVTFGESSELYGNAVNLDFGSAVLDGNGKIQVTGWGGDDNGDITISAGNVDIQGELKGAAKGENITIPGINMDYAPKPVTEEDLEDFTKVIPGQEAAYDTQKTDPASKADGNITIKGKNIQLRYGPKGTGKVSAGGSLTVGTKDGSASSYVDSDIAGVKGKVTISSAQSTLDVTNISDDAFFANHGNGNVINLEGGDNLVAFDGGANFEKVDAFLTKIGNAALQSNGAADLKLVHVWVDTADQFQKIGTDGDSLSRNYALRHTLDLSNVNGYKTIAGQAGQAFTGEFNGRGYSAVGLTVDDTTTTGGNLGLFGTIGKGGVVRNLTLHDIDINAAGADNQIGLIAGTNNGTIDGVTSWGGTVAGKGTLGGIAGTNAGTIQNVEANNMVYSESTDQTKKDTLGGIAGENTAGGQILGTLSNTGITNSGVGSQAMGGIAGKNAGTLSTVTTTGVTSGIYKVDNPNNESQKDTTSAADNVGGIAGTNTGTINGAYNKASVSGGNTVGGIVGDNQNKIQNAVNAMDVTGNAGGQNVGGIAGINNKTIDSVRNNGTVTGNMNVGGLVGTNKTAITNAINDGSAAIDGKTNVGGIAGVNDGTIQAQVQDNLVNEGTITGNQNVGGVAGLNNGTISNFNTNIELHAKGNNAQYFGGVAGQNGTTGVILNAKNTAAVSADGASYVGGIAGWNQGSLQSASNSGSVTGQSFVGGVAGLNTRNLQGYMDSDADNLKNNQEDILIQNSGNVTATKGGAGGIFGENRGNLGDPKHNKHIILSNSGSVTGKDENVNSEGTGGVIGVNSGTITHTSLRNEVKGTGAGTKAPTVRGTNNVGGIIGLNKGTVTGGRNDQAEQKTDYLGNTVNAEKNSRSSITVL